MNTASTIPTSEDPPSSPPSSIFLSFKRCISSISPRKTLRNLRLLILALAFSTLILDAITLSFEINVMNLDLAQKQVATQAALLFTPDLLAMTMALVLMLRDCFGCCRTHRPHRHGQEQEHEGSIPYQDEDEEIEGNQQQLRQQQEHRGIGLQGQGQEQEGVVDQRRGKSRSRSSRTSRRGTARELQQDGSISRSSSMDGFRTGNGAEQQSYDGGITSNNNNHFNNNNNNNIHHGQMDLAQEQRSLKFPGVHVQQQQPFKQLQPEQQRHYPREQLGDETNIVSNSNNRTQQRSRMLPPSTGSDATPAAITAGPSDLTKRASIPLSSSTTLSTPSPLLTSTTSSAVTATRTITNDSNSLHTRASTSSTTQSRNKQLRKKRRHSYYYIAFRILFSCGLAALALYWPASKRKPPLGYLPNLRESQNQHQGGESVSHNHNHSNNNSTGGGDVQRNSIITPTIVARAFLSFEPSKKLDPTPPITSTTLSTTPSFRTKSKRQRSSFDDDNNNNNGAPIEDDNSSDNVESTASDHYGTSGSGKGPGGHIPPNLRPGGPGSGGYGSHWCSLEEAFGDNQSAVVYCQVKDVRPIMTYVWASLILLELCVAYCAGDFAVAGMKHQRHSQSVSGGDRSAHDDDDDRKGDLESRTGAAVAVAAADNYPEMEERQPQWTTVGPGQDQAQRQGRQLGGHSGISITVTEADADGAGVGYSGSMDRGPTFAWKSSSTDKPIDH